MSTDKIIVPVWDPVNHDSASQRHIGIYDLDWNLLKAYTDKNMIVYYNMDYYYAIGAGRMARYEDQFYSMHQVTLGRYDIYTGEWLGQSNQQFWDQYLPEGDIIVDHATAQVYVISNTPDRRVWRLNASNAATNAWAALYDDGTGRWLDIDDDYVFVSMSNSPESGAVTRYNKDLTSPVSYIPGKIICMRGLSDGKDYVYTAVRETSSAGFIAKLNRSDMTVAQTGDLIIPAHTPEFMVLEGGSLHLVSWDSSAKRVYMEVDTEDVSKVINEGIIRDSENPENGLLSFLPTRWNIHNGRIYAFRPEKAGGDESQVAVIQCDPFELVLEKEFAGDDLRIRHAMNHFGILPLSLVPIPELSVSQEAADIELTWTYPEG